MDKNIDTIDFRLVMQLSSSVTHEDADNIVRRVNDYLKRDFDTSGFSPDNKRMCVTGFVTKAKYHPVNTRSNIICLQGEYGEDNPEV